MNTETIEELLRLHQIAIRQLAAIDAFQTRVIAASNQAEKIKEIFSGLYDSQMNSIDTLERCASRIAKSYINTTKKIDYVTGNIE